LPHVIALAPQQFVQDVACDRLRTFEVAEYSQYCFPLPLDAKRSLATILKHDRESLQFRSTGFTFGVAPDLTIPS
jgi:hypothetical protein